LEKKSCWDRSLTETLEKSVRKGEGCDPHIPTPAMADALNLTVKKKASKINKES